MAALRCKRWVAVPLAALLLAVWQGAVLHPLKHVDRSGHLVHLADVHSTDGGARDERDAQGNPADQLCDALAALSACAGGLPPLWNPGTGENARSFHRCAAPRAAGLAAYLAQAPPALS